MNKGKYLLTVLSEECAEVIQAASKSIRFGVDSGYPGETTTNREDVVQEFYEVMAVIEMLQERGILPIWSEERIKLQKEAKKIRVENNKQL